MNRERADEILNTWNNSVSSKLTLLEKAVVTGDESDYIIMLKIKRKDGTVLEVPIP